MPACNLDSPAPAQGKLGKPIARLMLMVLFVALSGCATVLCSFGQPDEPVKPYAGARCGLAYVSLPVTEEKMDGQAWVWWLGLLPLVALDFPFSVVGDTLLLPYTLAHE